MRHAGQTRQRHGRAGRVLGEDRVDDKSDTPGEQPSPTTDSRKSVRRGIFPLSLRAALVLVILAPIAASVGFAATTAIGRWSSRDEALDAQSSTLELDSLINAQVAITDEYVPTAVFAYAAAYHVTPPAIDSLLGIDFESELVAARAVVDRQSGLSDTASLAADYGELMSLRVAETKGTASFAQVQAFFEKFNAAIDAKWLSLHGALLSQADASAPLAMRNSLTVLGAAFAAFQSGLQQANYGTAVLTGPYTTAEVEGLITTTLQFDTAARAFSGQLGPGGTAAWNGFARNPQVRNFDAAMQLAIAVGLGHEAPPYATDLRAHAGVFKAEVERTAALTTLVLAASADLRAVTAAQASSMTEELIVDLLATALLLIVALGSALLLTRAVGRPLARIVSAAGAVRAGDFDLPPLDESGPKELALAAGAFNEMSSTLRAVETHAVALAENDLDNPVLRSRLPGRTGRALQGALDRLHQSMSASEEQRELLHERATHDSLTGLLNRGAAVEALGRDLARARRGGQAVALLFIDLDRLKVINDTFGHEGGDAAIRAVAAALQATTRQGDIVARLGGDEFVVGCLGAPDKAGPSRLAERIRESVSATVIDVGAHHVNIGCSIGIALSEPSDVDVDSLMNRADQALYLAKAEGRGGVRWAGAATTEPAQIVTDARPARDEALSTPGAVVR